MVHVHVVLVELFLGIQRSIDGPALRNVPRRHEPERLDSSLLRLYVAFSPTSLGGHGVFAILEIGALVRAREIRSTVLQVLTACSTRSENAISAISMDLIFVHVLEILYYLMLLILALLTQILLPILLCHTNVLLLQSILPRAAALLRILTIAVVFVDAVAVASNDLNFNLVGLRQTEALGEQAPTLLLTLFVPLQRLIGLAVRRALLYYIANKTHEHYQLRRSFKGILRIEYLRLVSPLRTRVCFTGPVLV